MGTKTRSKREKKTESQNIEQQCAHHWIIESPNGPISAGTCKKCGATKEFENWGIVER